MITTSISKGALGAVRRARDDIAGQALPGGGVGHDVIVFHKLAADGREIDRRSVRGQLSDEAGVSADSQAFLSTLFGVD